MVKILFWLIPILFFSNCSHRFENNSYISNKTEDVSISEIIHHKDIKLEQVQFTEINGWKTDDKKGSLKAFIRGCAKKRKINIKQTCKDGKILANTNPNNIEITNFFETKFTPYSLIDKYKEKETGLVTGYYVPLLNGSLKKTNRFKYPIYAIPRDFKIPYLSHRRIDSKIINADVICWVDDRVERSFLHIQGSGTIKLRNGKLIGVGYAERNGYSYSSIGTYIHRKFKVPLYKLSAGFIKKWIKSHPKYADEVLHSNRSFVFFRKQKSNLALGAMGTNLVPQSTLAIDTKNLPLGIPIYIESKTNKHLNHLFMAQDRGGAIKGVIRADLFFGFGTKAGKFAGTMKTQGKFYVLLPKGFSMFAN